MTVSFPSSPAGTVDSVRNPGTEPLARTYVIERGDTLPALAERFETSSELLLASNPQIVSPHALYPGDTLQLPAPDADAAALSVGTSEGTQEPSCGKDGLWDKILRMVKLEAYLQDAAAQSPTFAKLLNQARRDGVRITVLSDCEYARRHPGTAGTTFGDGHVYVPESAISNGGTGALEHEIVHGILFKHNEIFDKNIPLDQRLEQARELFGNMGLDPEDGARLVNAYERNGESHHVHTRVIGVDIARERKGLPPLSPAQRDALYEAVSSREAALNVQRWINDQIQNQHRDPVEVYRKAEAKWAATGVGAEHPPAGATAGERRASLDVVLARFADESAVTRFEN